MRKLLTSSADIVRRASVQSSLPHTVGMVKAIDIRRKQIIDDRISDIPIESHSVRLLRYIISNAPIDYLCGITNIYDLYDSVVQYRDVLEQPIQINSIGTRHGTFFSGRVKEFVFPVTCSNYYDRLSITHDDLATWKHIRPVRIVSHDSKELSLKMYLNKISIENDPPSYAVITVDVVFLVLYFVRYLQSTNLKYTGVSAVTFIHSYVLTTNLARDIVDIWLLSLYGELIKNHRYIPTMYTNNNIYSLDTGRTRETCDELRKRVTSLSSGGITPQEFLNGLVLSEGRTYHDFVDELDTYSNIDSLYQYEWAALLHDYQMLRIITSVVSENPKASSARTIATRLTSAFNIMKMSRFWTSVRDKGVEANIVTMFSDMYDDILGRKV